MPLEIFAKQSEDMNKLVLYPGGGNTESRREIAEAAQIYGRATSRMVNILRRGSNALFPPVVISMAEHVRPISID
jgi:hypothetical protein